MVSVALGAPLFYSINLGNLALDQGIPNNVCSVFGGGKGEIMPNYAFYKCRKCRIIIGGAQKQSVCDKICNILQHFKNIKITGYAWRVQKGQNWSKMKHC